MATRVAIQADIDNSIYSDWITANIIPFHGILQIAVEPAITPYDAMAGSFEGPPFLFPHLLQGGGA